MSESQITKHVLAQAIKALMETKPLAKISIGDITRHCGINRQTFYYHFKDKYDLVNWIYYTETMEYMGSFMTLEGWVDGLWELCNYVQENKKFYINALNTPGQNSFQEYLTQFLHELILSLIDDLRGDKIIPEDEVNFISDFYTCAFVGLILNWAKQGMKEDPRDYINRIKNLVDGGILQEIRKY